MRYLLRHHGIWLPLKAKVHRATARNAKFSGCTALTLCVERAWWLHSTAEVSSAHVYTLICVRILYHRNRGDKWPFGAEWAYVRGRISNLCEAKPRLQDSRVIPNKLLISWSVNGFLPANLAWPVQPDRQQWSYLVGGPHCPHHSPTIELVVFYSERYQAKNHHSHATVAVFVALLIHLAWTHFIHV